MREERTMPRCVEEPLAPGCVLCRSSGAATWPRVSDGELLRGQRHRRAAPLAPRRGAGSRGLHLSRLHGGRCGVIMVPLRHLLAQGPMLRALGSLVRVALSKPPSGGPAPATPGPWIEAELPPRPEALVRDYV